MLKSISAWAFQSGRTASEIFAIAKEKGFEAVEVTIGTGPDVNYQVTPDSTPEECAAVVAAAEAAGVKISSVASGLGWGLPATSVDPAVRAESVAVTAKCLQVAGYLGTDALLWVPGAVGAEFIPGLGVTSYDVAYTNALNAAKELAPVAEAAGVTLAVENVWNKFLLSPLEMRDFVDAVGSPRMGTYFDVGNVLLTGYPEQWIQILGRRVTRIHIKDFKRSVGTLDGFCDLLEGDVDFAGVKQALRAIGYTGSLTAEFFNCEADLDKISSAMDKIVAL